MSRFSEIRRVDSTGSTNEDIAKILGTAEARGLTLVADFQTRGAGRKGRSWIAPPGSALLFTTALPEKIRADHLWVVPFWIGLAVHDALADFGVATQLQWPNDVLLNRTKVAGILCISRVAGDKAWVGCGVGINVRRLPQDDGLREIVPPPAFVSDVRTIDRQNLLAAILKRADESYDDLRSTETIVHAWEKAARIPGARYRLLLDGASKPFDAPALRLADGGALLVDRNGAPHAIGLADARVVR